MANAHLIKNLTWYWEDWRGRDCEADIEVSYQYDGETVGEYKLSYCGPDLPEYEEERLINCIEEDYAPEAYEEWLAENADYRREGMIDAGLLA